MGYLCRTLLRRHDEDQVSVKMTRTELIIQLLKIPIGLAFGASRLVEFRSARSIGP
jgi:hypothetical protein